MGYSGLIYAVIVAAWAAVLVPRWIRRNDEIERARAADEARGVRVLERRAGAIRGGQVSASARALGMPGQRQFHAVPSAAPVVDPASGNKEAYGGAGHNKEAYGRHGDNEEAYGGRRDNEEAYGGAEFGLAARRRRRVLGALAVGLAAVVVAVAAGIMPPAAVTAPTALLGGFLVLARRAAVAEDHRRVRTRRTAIRRAAADRDAAPAKRIAVFEPEPIPITDPNAWEPVPVPRPTYLTKAKAPPPVTRSIDLSSPGAWTSGRLNPASSVARSGTTRDPAREATADDQDAAELPQRRRAVGD